MLIRICLLYDAYFYDMNLVSDSGLLCSRGGLNLSGKCIEGRSLYLVPLTFIFI